MYQLSILIPSKYPDKLGRLINNLDKTIADPSNVEIVICLDGSEPTRRRGNIVTCYSPPTKYRSTFHEKPALESSGRFMLMANDDIEFVTKGWDKMIPYEKYPDDLVLFHFKDRHFNEEFACHPIFSRRVLTFAPDLLSPLFQITKCDNTIWDIHPPNRRVYLPQIELIHHHEGYDKEWIPVYEEDNGEYLSDKNVTARNKVRDRILTELNMNQRLLIGVVTAEMARRADFYDNFNQLEKPLNSICMSVHGQSIAHNRNIVVEQAIVHGCSHVMFLDDDVMCKSKTIFQLLRHNKDIVSALQLKRNFPHLPLVFDQYLGDGLFKHYELNDKITEGLIPIKAAGLGCILIKTSVFTKMEKPYFRFGEIRKDQLSEDIGFFVRVNELGVQSFCDLDAQVGHVASAIVRPKVIEGKWALDYDTNGNNTASFPVPVIVQQETPKEYSNV